MSGFAAGVFGRVLTVQEVETPNNTSAPTERASAIDLSARPEAAWLDGVEGEVEDVDRVLKCLSRDSAKMCETCDGLGARGELDGRPVLARCAQSKQPR